MKWRFICIILTGCLLAGVSGCDKSASEKIEDNTQEISDLKERQASLKKRQEVTAETLLTTSEVVAENRTRVIELSNFHIAALHKKEREDEAEDVWKIDVGTKLDDVIDRVDTLEASLPDGSDPPVAPVPSTAPAPPDVPEPATPPPAAASRPAGEITLGEVTEVFKGVAELLQATEKMKKSLEDLSSEDTEDTSPTPPPARTFLGPNGAMYRHGYSPHGPWAAWGYRGGGAMVYPPVPTATASSIGDPHYHMQGYYRPTLLMEYQGYDPLRRRLFRVQKVLP